MSSIRTLFRLDQNLLSRCEPGKPDIALEGIVRHSVVDVGMGIQFTNLSAVSKRRLIIHMASLVSAPSQIVES